MTESTADPLRPPESGRRRFLLAAIEDAASTIRATDTKASIALVVHGFIFTGMIGLLSRLGTSFDEGAPCFRGLVIGLTALMGIAFSASVFQLLRCVRPAPSKAIPNTPTYGVFYLQESASPWSGIATSIPSFDAFRQRIEAMDEENVEAELTAELLKVSAIRSRKVALVASGLIALGFEIMLAVILLTLLAANQI